MSKHQDIISRWTRLVMEAKELGLATISITPENMLMILGKLPTCSTEKPADCQNDCQAAIDILRDGTTREFDDGFRPHHNTLIYATNELKSAQALRREVSHES